MILFIFLFQLATPEDTLLLSQVVFRHGFRAPIYSLSSKESEKYFFRGLGQITNEGIKQGYDLGRALRKRLVDNGFLNKNFVPLEVYFRSSAVPRCLTTAAAMGSALFDPVAPTVPIFVNIQTIPESEDYMCATLTSPKLLKETFRSAGLEIYSNTTKKQFGEFFMGRKKNKYLTDKKRILKSEAYLIEKSVGLPVPEWFTDDAAKEAEQLRYQTFTAVCGAAEYSNPLLIKCRAGLLLHTIMSNIRKRLNSTDITDVRKFYAFATHDFNLMAFLHSLGIMDVALKEHCPQFTAALLIELRQPQNGNPYVQVFYRNPEGPFIPLTSYVNNCNSLENCSVSDFLSCCNDFVTDNPEKECK